MTAPELDRARSWSAALAGVLDEVTAQLAVAAARLADGWPDLRGEEWAHRLRVLGATLQREADAAVEFGRAVDRVPDTAAPLVDGDAGVADGPRLGDTAARRADDRRGVTIPQWDMRDDRTDPED